MLPWADLVKYLVMSILQKTQVFLGGLCDECVMAVTMM